MYKLMTTEGEKNVIYIKWMRNKRWEWFKEQVRINERIDTERRSK